MEMPAEEAMEQGGSPDPMTLVSNIGRDMSTLAQMLGQMQAPDEVLAGASEIMERFSALADQVTQGMGGGEGGGPVPADQGAMPMQAGAKGVPGGPQSRM